jgi:hypothetical protein
MRTLSPIVSLVWLVAASLAVVAPRAAAQEAVVSASETEARERFEAGRTHARYERWAEALLEFQASEALTPRAVTEFNIAATLLRLGRAREALEMIVRLEARDDLDERVARDLMSLRAAARDVIRTLAVAVAPADARIEIDGEVIEGTGSPRAIPLDPGPHAIVVTAPGHAEHRATLGADAVTFGVELSALPAVLVVHVPEPDAQIEIDGITAGTGDAEREVEVGVHHVRVTRPGRVPFEMDAEILQAERLVVNATLIDPPPTPLHEEPLLWVGVSLGVLAIAGAAIGIAFASTPQPSGGSSGILIAPLARF